LPSTGFSDWLDARTGYRALVREALDEAIPGGARWRYVFGSALTCTFLIQFVTGLLLMTSYVPSSAHAWGSVWYISEEMSFGWLIRGIHHFGSSAMIVLLGMHLVQVVIAGAYRRPREINWWFGMGLMFLVLAFGLTGYLLPWDQKGYWATKVATNIAGGTPVIGPAIQRVIVGGAEYGNQTLTRFYGLHVGVLPLLTILLIAGHIALFRRHGVTHPPNPKGEDRFWPKQAFLDIVASTIVFGIVLLLVLMEGGANLEAPADPSSVDYPARPEWYFLPLFQMLKLPIFAGEREVLGTVVVPGAIVTLLLLYPLLDRVLPRGIAHFGACGFLFALIGSAAYLTYAAIDEDMNDRRFLEARAKANNNRERALKLAGARGIPPDGATYLLQRDPYTRGMEVLESKCLGCHVYGGRGAVSTSYAELAAEDREEVPEDILEQLPDDWPETQRRALAAALPEGFEFEEVVEPSEQAEPNTLAVAGKNAAGEPIEAEVSPDGTLVTVSTESVQSASDLKGFGTREWIRGLLEDPSDPAYFGKVPQQQGMKGWKETSLLTPEELDQVADFFEQSVSTVEPGLSAQTWELQFYTESGDLKEDVPPGFEMWTYECSNCHAWGVGGADFTGVNAPNLFGWGSRAWFERMVSNPGSRDLYGFLEEHEQMPAFEGELTENDFEVLYQLLKGQGVPPGSSDADSAASSASRQPAADDSNPSESDTEG